MQLAPVILFVYNRLEHTKRTINALRKNTLAIDSDLIIFSDGAKESSDSQLKVLKLREYLLTISGFKSVKIVLRPKNYGLSQSIISGVSEVIQEFGQAIILEDDIITSIYFLEYLNQSLEIYRYDDRVISIHGYIYPVRETLPESYFLKGADCQGWATWQRGWDLFEYDGQKLFNKIKARKLVREFNFSGSNPYFKMLKNQILGKNDSWAIRWYASAFLKDKLTLYPGKSLIYNSGFDGSGVHCGDVDNFNKTKEVENVRINLSKIKVEESAEARQAVINYFSIQNGYRLKLLRLFKRIIRLFYDY